jgi:hypothetical protein
MKFTIIGILFLSIYSKITLEDKRRIDEQSAIDDLSIDFLTMDQVSK